MKVYKDIITGDEMFTDTYKMKLVNDVIYEVQGNFILRNQDNIVLAGANPSAETGGDEEDQTVDGVERGVDIVLNHRLQESFAFGDKKSFTLHLKDYMRKIVENLQENSPNEVDVFKANMQQTIKDILVRFRELQFFTGESMDVEGMVAMCEYREINGESVPVFMFFKHGLQEEKL